MGRFLRCLLIIAGSALFGLSAAAIGTHGLLTAMTGGIKQDGWGAAPAWLLFVAVGGGIGLIAGLAISIGWIRSRDCPGYRVFEWLGLLLGIAAGIGAVFLVPDRYHWFVQCVVGGATVPPCAAIGRALIGGTIGPRLVAHSKPPGRNGD